MPCAAPSPGSLLGKCGPSIRLKQQTAQLSSLTQRPKPVLKTQTQRENDKVPTRLHNHNQSSGVARGMCSKGKIEFIVHVPINTANIYVEKVSSELKYPLEKPQENVNR